MENKKVMAENKKSFLMYCDDQELFNSLSDEEAGKLIKHIYNYVNDENPVAPDRTTELLFIKIKTALKRDLKKYENIVERNRVNGSKGGRPKKQKKPTGITGNPKKPQKADKDNDSVTVKDNDKETKKKAAPLSPLSLSLLDFKEFRKKQRKPLTDLAEKLLLKRLDKLSKTDEEKILILEQSIMNGWTSVYAIKEDSNGKTVSDIPAEPNQKWYKDFRRTPDEINEARKSWLAAGYKWDSKLNWYVK